MSSSFQLRGEPEKSIECTAMPWARTLTGFAFSWLIFFGCVYFDMRGILRHCLAFSFVINTITPQKKSEHAKQHSRSCAPPTSP